MAKAWNIQRRRNIGSANLTPPSGVDYDMGRSGRIPAVSIESIPLRLALVAQLGTGDIGNDGAHEMDIARWGLGVSGLLIRSAMVAVLPMTISSSRIQPIVFFSGLVTAPSVVENN